MGGEFYDMRLREESLQVIQGLLVTLKSKITGVKIFNSFKHINLSIIQN